MERFPVISLAAFLMLISTFAQAQTTSDVCSGIDCQQGTCTPLSNTSYPSNILSPYECKCNPGWKTVKGLVASLPEVLTLPCTVPNCTLTLGCDSSPAPAVQAPPTLTNVSSPCALPGICGHGSCLVTDWTKYPPMYNCTCEAGYGNAGNLTAGYCLKPCEVGANCRALGITVSTPKASAGSRQGPFDSYFLGTMAIILASSCVSMLW